MLRKILVTADEYSDKRTAHSLVRRCKDFNTILSYNLIYIQMAITEQF
jgi:hypothetical protein